MASLHTTGNVAISMRHRRSSLDPATDTWQPTMSLSVAGRCSISAYENTRYPVFSVAHNATVPSLLVVPPWCRGKDNFHSELVVSVFHQPRRKMEKLKFSRRVEWWQNMMFPIRRVWVGIATRLRIRKTGLLKLQHDVRACEYEDIRVMWEILNRNESEFVHSPRKSNKRNCWKLFRWARCAPCICRS